MTSPANPPSTGPAPADSHSAAVRGDAITAAGIDAYAAAVESRDTPLLGHLVLYSIFDGRVKREDLERWFLDLGLDSAFLPPTIRPVDAFEQVTGPRGVRRTYPLDGTRPLTASGKRKRRPTNGTAKEATLMVRHVRRDANQIIRHLVREVRDEQNTTLSYDTHLGECVFARDTSDQAGPGAGTLQVTPDHAAIKALPAAERDTVYDVLDELKETYNQRRVFFTADRLRTLIRGIVEDLDATKVRPTGGVYFVQRAHADTLAALRDLVSRMGEGSKLSRIPIPDQDEMREMIQAAFVDQAKEDLDRLARDIATARADGAPESTVNALVSRFRQLQTATTQHADLLSTSLEDTKASLQLVNLQLASLLATVGDDSDAEQGATPGKSTA